MRIPDTDEGWKKKLSPDAYRSLRLGEPEASNAGAYTNVHSPGVYVCAGCGSPLFSSEQKSDIGSGHATFIIPPDGGPVSLVRTYSPEGEERTAAKCERCGGVIGVLADMALRSADDLTEGKAQRFIYANSHSIKLHRSLSPTSYPYAFLFALVLLSVVGFGVWQWSASWRGVGTFKNISETLQVWVGDIEVHATTFREDQLQPGGFDPVLRDTALLIVLARTPPTPIMIHARPVDVLWLDGMFSVVEAEQGVLMDGSVVWNKPPAASFALITRSGVLPGSSFMPGTTIIVPNKGQLF
jgi:peptide-methionine (R)-S-oxide reductase